MPKYQFKSKQEITHCYECPLCENADLELTDNDWCLLKNKEMKPTDNLKPKWCPLKEMVEEV